MENTPRLLFHFLHRLLFTPGHIDHIDQPRHVQNIEDVLLQIVKHELPFFSHQRLRRKQKTAQSRAGDIFQSRQVADDPGLALFYPLFKKALHLSDVIRIHAPGDAENEHPAFLRSLYFQNRSCSELEKLKLICFLIPVHVLDDDFHRDFP